MSMGIEWIESGVIVFVRNDSETIKMCCKVNMESLEVFGFDLTKVFNKDLRLLNREYLILNGVFWDVYGASDELKLETDYWYNDL